MWNLNICFHWVNISKQKKKVKFFKSFETKISRSSVYNLLGTISEAKGDNNQALSFYKSANNENKNWQSPYLSMAKIHLNLSNFDKALSMLEQAKNLRLATITIMLLKVSILAIEIKL